MGSLRRIWRQGHSCVISVPKWMCDHMAMSEGDYLELAMIDEVTIMCKLKRSYEIKNRIDGHGKPFKGGDKPG